MKRFIKIQSSSVAPKFSQPFPQERRKQKTAGDEASVHGSP